MPFKAPIFKQNMEQSVDGPARDELEQLCDGYAALTSPQQKARAIEEMMAVLDQNVPAETRKRIMEECGRRCIGASTLDKARQLQRDAADLDDLLRRMNETHIGGGRLLREENVIHASYERCYCGSVSRGSGQFSATYCQCSCGWYRQLFETLLGRPVEVELLSSIIQGHERCEFLIHL